MVAIPTRASIVASLPDRGLELAAVLPIHYPRALLRAYGLHPMEIWGPAGIEPIEGNVHFQSYTCGIVRNATSFILQGKADAARVVLIPHTCDALQGMASVLKDFIETRQRIITLYLPRDERPTDLDFLVDEIRHVGRQLEEVTGRAPSDADLRAAIELDEAADAALAELALNRPLVDLDDASFYALVRSREYLPSEDFIRIAKEAPRRRTPRDAGVPIMISGITPEPMEIFEHIEEMGATVVADDLACVSRRLYPSGSSKDPWRRLAERLSWAGPDPTRGAPIRKRAQFLATRLEETGARGLLVYDVKFCEPELFDVPLLRQTLEGRKLPMLHVEFDLARTISQQTLTRIEAFVEMLR